MATLTDPARELSDIAKRLMISSSDPGEKLVADQFAVDRWSTEFFRIIGCIFERADLVARIVGASGLDDDVKATAISDLAEFKVGFTGASLMNGWNTSGHGLTRMRDFGKNLSYLQDTVRNQVAYPKLTTQEIEELIGLIEDYLKALPPLDPSEPPFVRQAIIEGLQGFHFQLKYVSWTGSGYALAAFRQVMSIYESYHGRYEQGGNPNAEAVLRGLGTIIKSAKEKIDSAKGYSEAGQFIWSTYNMVTSIAAPLLLIGHSPK